jgi:hypothetical protein
MESAYSYATDSAYPHNRFLSPLNLYFAWPLGVSDAIMHKAIKESVRVIRNAAIAEGQDLTNLYTYPNYALGDAPLESMYGDNLPTLRQIKSTYDPGNVMGLAGGYVTSTSAWSLTGPY